MAELLPCTGEGCVIASCCKLADDYEDVIDGRTMDPPAHVNGYCPAFQINQRTVDELKLQYGEPTDGQ